MPLFQCDNCGTMDNTALSECGYEQMNYFLEDPVLINKYKKEFGLKVVIVKGLRSKNKVLEVID